MSRPRPTPAENSSVRRLPRDRGARRVFAVTWLLASLLGILWAIATPIGASPDEPAHLVKAASVARGQLLGEPTARGHLVEVPRYVGATHSVECIVLQPNIPADCIDGDTPDPSAAVLTTTTAGADNPLYYALVGWPGLLAGDATGIYAMRIASAILSALFLAFTVQFAMRLGHRALSLAAVGVAMTPTLLFLSGAVNPIAIEATATMAAFTAMLTVVRRGAEGRIVGPLAIAAVAAVVGAQMRGLSPLWIAVAVAAPLLLISGAQLRVLFRRRAVWVSVGAVGLGVLLSALWTLGSSALTGMPGNGENFQEHPGVGTNPVTGFIVAFLGTWDSGTQLIASFGWLDTPAPEVVYFVWSGFIGALALGGVALLRGRPLGFAGVLTAALVLLPPFVQAADVPAGGNAWQGPHALPLFAIAVIGVAVVLGERLTAAIRDTTVANRWPSGGSGRLLALVWLVWAAAQLFCFAVALQRHSVGIDGTWGAMVRQPEWAPPGGTLLAFGSFAVLTLGTAFLAWWATARSGKDAPGAACEASGIFDRSPGHP